MRKGKEHAISSQLLSGETRIWSPHCLTSTSIFFYSCCLVTKSYLTLCNLMDYTASQAPLSSTISWSSLKFKSIKLVMLSNQLILCHPLLLLPSIFTSIRVFSSDWLFTSGGQSIEASASVSVLPIIFRFYFLQVWLVWSPCFQGTLKSLLHHHKLKASILTHSAFFMVQLAHPNTGKTTAFTMQTFVGKVGKVMALLSNTVSRFLIALLPRSKHLLISRLQIGRASCRERV